MLKTIYKTVDALGPIEVLDDGTKRYLSFGNGHEQSCQIKAQPHIPQHEYTRAIMLSLLFCKPQHIGVMGLGGGTLACGFLNACEHATIRAIELRSEVITLAHRYFALPKHETRLCITNQDASEYIKQTTNQFDLLVADLYHQHGIDDAQMQRDFLKDCAHKVTDTGWLVLNYWLDHDISRDILQQLHEDFSCVYMCNSGGGNLILYAGKSQPDNDFLSQQNSKALSNVLGFSLSYYIKRLKYVGAI